MSQTLDLLYKDAIDLLHRLTTPYGILASTIEADNYKRIWARDSIVCGMAGLMINDPVLIGGLKNSLLTLTLFQNDLGMIPSNVLVKDRDVSFGSLAGRVDANTWFVLGCCKYYQETSDEATWLKLKPAVEKCRNYLQATETNTKGWIYTPLSGNWADEYPVHGYTLYDNMLRLWGETVWFEITNDTSFPLPQMKQKNLLNFWPSKANESTQAYHQRSYEEINFSAVQHFMAFILPGIYDNRFDAAGNALGLLQFDLNEFQKVQLKEFIAQLSEELSKPLIPAFWPIITEESDDWNLLKNNFSFDFKNRAGDFHNGGIWPVWMGLFCLGLSKNGLKSEANQIIKSFVETVDKSPTWNFEEYFNANTLQAGGKTQMGYTASGIVFMKMALTQY